MKTFTTFNDFLQNENSIGYGATIFIEGVETYKEDHFQYRLDPKESQFDTFQQLQQQSFSNGLNFQLG